MKRALSVFFVLRLCLCLSTVCFAQGEDGVDVKAYVQEKIVPVIVAVLTSVLAFLATIGTVARSLKSLKDTRDSFADEAKERAVFFESGMALLEDKAQELKAMVEGVPELKSKIEELTQKEELLAEILSLGFSANSEIVKSGKGKRMALLLQNAKSTVGASPRPTGAVGVTEKEVSANETI